MQDVPLVGGKNASLGEMYRALAAQQVKVPNGFATTAEAYRYYLRHNKLDQRIDAALAALDSSDVTGPGRHRRQDPPMDHAR